MVKDPFRKWDRVDTVCALLVDLGKHFFTANSGNLQNTIGMYVLDLTIVWISAEHKS